MFVVQRAGTLLREAPVLAKHSFSPGAEVAILTRPCRTKSIGRAWSHDMRTPPKQVLA